MKKVAFVLVAGLLIFTGCGNKDNNKIVCSGTREEEGQEIKLEVTATLKDKKIDKVSASMEFDKEESATAMCSIFTFANQLATDEKDKIDFKCDGSKIIFNDYTSMIADDDDLQIVGLSKDDFIKVMENEKLSCK